MPRSISIHSQGARPAGRNAGKGDLQVRKPGKTPGTGIAGPRSSAGARCQGIADQLGLRACLFQAAAGGAHDLALVARLRLAGLEWVSRESLFTFVTDGIDSVLAQARAVARDKDVGIGGANVIRQSLATGLVEELRLRVAPVLLRVRKGLSDIFGNQIIELERISVVGSPYATHLFFMSAADRFQRRAPRPERHRTSP